MSRVFCFGVLLAGFALCVGCGEPLDTPTVDPALDSPAYEQEMTEGTETPMDTQEGAIETTEDFPAETAPAEAPAEEAATPEATDAP
ncbi:MAG TPA: hypothetical protein VMM76_06345 [Pirellulaceae bacterium]|nr:hypothetical protein [Pirellulaceae bacterium]